MSLAEFVLARIAEDEHAAQVRTVSRRMISGKMVDIPMHNAPGFWAWSPERVLAECEAKRRIVELHNRNHECSQYDHTGDIDNCTWFVLDEDGCSTTRLLALPYADHDDYDERWRL